jgi:phosphoglycolate phosphatase-like HAD superfamily hydrolase
MVMDEVVRAPFVAGAKEFLEGNSSKYRFFIVSATPQDEIDEIVKRRKIGHYFARIYGAPTAKMDAVKDIIMREKTGPGSALYVGDAISDYMAAKNNSVIFIARISDGDSIFSGIDCRKVRDLTDICRVIGTYEK